MRVRLDPGRCRVDDGDPRLHEGTELAVPEYFPGPGQFGAAVDAESLVRVLRQQTVHRAGIDGKSHHVGEVVLSLTVVAPQTSQGPGEKGAVKAVGARVYLPDGALRRCGVLFLTDGFDAPFRPPKDPSVSPGVVDDGGEDGDRRAGPAVARDQPPEGLHRQQGGVSREHQHIPLPGQQGPGLAHRVARAELFCLADGLKFLFRKKGCHLLRHVAHHHRLSVGPHGTGEVKGIGEHGPAEDRVKDLGRVGLHPRPLAGGEDQDGEGLFLHE
jgi:hypothetical protein